MRFLNEEFPLPRWPASKPLAMDSFSCSGHTHSGAEAQLASKRPDVSSSLIEQKRWHTVPSLAVLGGRGLPTSGALGMSPLSPGGDEPDSNADSRRPRANGPLSRSRLLSRSAGKADGRENSSTRFLCKTKCCHYSCLTRRMPNPRPSRAGEVATESSPLLPPIC